MTEADWLACDDPWVLLNHLAGEPSERKYRLFACACCRHIWHLLTDQWSRKTVEIAESYAQGEATYEQLTASRQASNWDAAVQAGQSPDDGAWGYAFNAARDVAQMPSGELAPDRLTVLADALEESGSPDELVVHLRSPGPHVRGCWAIDAILGLG